MNTRVKLLVAASLLLGAIHQPVLAGNSTSATTVASGAASNVTKIATAPNLSIVPTVAPTLEEDENAPSPAPTPLRVTPPTSAPSNRAASQKLDLSNIVKGALDKNLPVLVVVDKQKHFTHVLQLQNRVVTEVLCVQNSTGKPSTPTPEGRSVITQKQLDPSWKPPVSIDPQQRVVQPWSKTHRNPLGMANLRLSMDRGMIGLHGTNEPKQIGKNVSHGCIRHRNADILKVSAIVSVGTPVYIVPSLDRANVLVSDAMPQTVTMTHSATTARTNSTPGSVTTARTNSTPGSVTTAPTAVLPAPRKS